MIDKKFLQKLLAAYRGHQSMRHDVIARSNEALRFAKQAIFRLHRADHKGSREQLDQVKKLLATLQKQLLKKHPELMHQGAYLAALEEYAEAELFYGAMVQGKVAEIKGIQIAAEQYLAALADLTGELTRQAVLKATERDHATVEKYFRITEELVGGLIQFDLVGVLRQKYDDAKRNLKRLESVRYDMSLRGK
jgi:translin